MTDQPEPSILPDAPTLAAINDLGIGESVKVNGGREDIKRVSDDRWVLSLDVEGTLVPIAHLVSDGSQFTVPLEEQALMPRRVKPWQLDITFQTTQFDEAAFNQLVEDAIRAGKNPAPEREPGGLSTQPTSTEGTA
jgi:hypothetical protein